MTALSPRIVGVLDRTPGFVAGRMRSGARLTRALRPMVNATLPDREIAVRVRSGAAAGLRLPILPRSEKFYWTGVHERHVQDALAALLRPGMRFWDVGAHIGFFSLLASRLVGGAGRVEAFEPYPPNRVRLLRSIGLNQASNVGVHAVALGASSGTAMFHTGSSSLMGSLVGHGGAGMPVRCQSADDAMRTVAAPQVVKIDAEGGELAVLRGAGRMLATVRPAVLIELTSDDMLGELRALAPAHRVERLAANHWLLAPR